LAAGPLFVTDVRKEVVDFSVTFLDAHASVLLSKPPNGDPGTIRTIEDLVSQSDLKYGTLATGIIPRTFKRTNDTLIRTMWRKMLLFGPSVFTVTNKEGIELVRRERFAFVLPDTIAEYVAMRPPCNLVSIGPFLLTTGYALALQKNSPYTELFNTALRTLRQNGYLDRLKYQWWTARDMCNSVARSSKMYRLNSASTTQTPNHLSTLCAVVCLLTIALQNQTKLKHLVASTKSSLIFRETTEFLNIS